MISEKQVLDLLPTANYRQAIKLFTIRLTCSSVFRFYTPESYFFRTISLMIGVSESYVICNRDGQGMWPFHEGQNPEGQWDGGLAHPLKLILCEDSKNWGCDPGMHFTRKIQNKFEAYHLHLGLFSDKVGHNYFKKCAQH